MVAPAAAAAPVIWPYIMGGLSVLGSWFSSSAANQRAEDANQAALDFAKQQYAEWQELYGPLEGMIVDEVTKPIEQYAPYQHARGVLETQYGTADAALRRRGAVQTGGGSGIDQARRSAAYYTKAGQQTALRAGAENSRLNNMMNAARIGRGTNPSALSLQNVYNQQGSDANRFAADAGKDLSTTAGNLSMLWMLYGGGQGSSSGVGPGYPSTPDLYNWRDQ